MPFDFETNSTFADEATFTAAVPEPYRGYFTKGEGGAFVVNPALKPLVDDYVGVSKKLNSVSKDKKTASDEAATRRLALKNFTDTMTELGIELEEGKEPHEVLKLKVGELVEANKTGKSVKVDMDKLKAEYSRKEAEFKTAADQRVERMFNSLSEEMIGKNVATELAKAGVIQSGVALLMPHALNQMKVLEEDGKYVACVVDAQGDRRSDGKGGWLSAADLVAELKQAYPMAFASQTPSGSGKGPDKTKVNPALGAGDKTPTQKIAEGLAKLNR